jgi:uncharacterized membrane protein
VSARPGGRPQIAAVVLLVIAYAGLSHYSNSTPGAHGLGAALALGPVSIVSLVMLRRWAGPWVTALLAAAAAALLYWYWPLFAENFTWFYLLEECAVYGLLAVTFGRTLLGKRVALCTRLADRVHGPLSAREVRYSRRVTAAWTAFFVSLAVATIGLFVWAPLRIWSLFTNFCTLPLIALMFVAENMLRRRALPQSHRTSILTTVRVYLAGSH